MKLLIGSSIIMVLGGIFLVTEMNHQQTDHKNHLLDKKSWFEVVDEYNGCDVVKYSAKGDHGGSAFFLDCEGKMYNKYHN